MINVMICTPSSGFMRLRYSSSMLRMLTYYQGHAPLGLEDHVRQMSYHVIEGSMIDQARETFAEEFLETDATHLCFIDDDMGFREDVLNILLSRQVPFVSVNYRMKVPPCMFTARSLDGKHWVETTKDSDSLEEVAFNGFGFSLIERQVLEKMSMPRFSNLWNSELSKHTTEDYTFCLKARELGFPPLIDHKASKRVYHVGYHNYSWDDDFTNINPVPIAERLE